VVGAHDGQPHAKVPHTFVSRVSRAFGLKPRLEDIWRRPMQPTAPASRFLGGKSTGRSTTAIPTMASRG
jgi:hypothetical protein